MKWLPLNAECAVTASTSTAPGTARSLLCVDYLLLPIARLCYL